MCSFSLTRSLTCSPRTYTQCGIVCLCRVSNALHFKMLYELWLITFQAASHGYIRGSPSPHTHADAHTHRLNETAKSAVNDKNTNDDLRRRRSSVVVILVRVVGAARSLAVSLDSYHDEAKENKNHNSQRRSAALAQQFRQIVSAAN